MIVGKAVNMAKMMNIHILGLVENMSFVECPDCGKKIEVFGKSHAEQVAMQYHMPLLARLPLDPQIAQACDAGAFEAYEGKRLGQAADAIQVL